MGLVEPWEGYDWRDDREVVGVNAMTLGLWAEVLGRWVGPATRVAAIGKTHRRQRRTPTGEWVDTVVPDSLAVAAELECGATASYHFSSGSPFGPGHTIEIHGNRGVLVYLLSKDEIRGATVGDDELRMIPIPREEERSHDTDAAFVRAIQEGTPVSPDFEEGLRYMEFCEAVALSLKTGAIVSLPLSRASMESWDRFMGDDPA
jgi:predicted dehydrogenase